MVLPDAVRVIIELDGEVSFHDERLANPLRVFVDLPGPAPDAPDAVEMTRSAGHIRFDNVHFNYQGRTGTLSGITLDVQPGNVVAIVGATASPRPGEQDSATARASADAPRSAAAATEAARATGSAPAHRPQGWGDAAATFQERLREVEKKPPQQALDVADHSAKRLFDTLPIHLNMRELDEPVVYGAVRFRMIAVRQEMQRRFAAAALAKELTG